jgi:hypothetical protein
MKKARAGRAGWSCCLVNLGRSRAVNRAPPVEPYVTRASAIFDAENAHLRATVAARDVRAVKALPDKDRSDSDVGEWRFCARRLLVAVTGVKKPPRRAASLFVFER